MTNVYRSNKITSFICALFLLSFLYNGNAAFGQTANTWTQKANTGGSARYAVSGFNVGSKGYFVGGNGGTEISDLWEYDPSTNVWTQKANFAGGGRHYMVGFAIGSKGYVGTGQNGSTYYNDFYEYDPSTNIWTVKASMPGVRYVATGFSVGSKGYVGLGSSGSSFLNDFYEFDPSLNTWTAKTNYPGAARYGAPSFSVGTKGYVVGGSNGTVMSDCYEYDPAGNTWTTKASLPVAKWLTNGFGISSKGYVGAGNSSSGLANDFYEFDPVANTWATKASVGGGTRGYGPAAFSIGMKGYMGAGYNVTYMNDFWEYTVFGAAEALNFDGVDDQVNISNTMSTLLDPMNKITVEAWVKPANNTYLGVIVGNYSSPTTGQMQFLLRRDNDQFAFWVDDGTGFKSVTSGALTSTVGIWQHVAGVWDGSKIMIYVNGVLKATTTGVTGTSFASTANSVRMGADSQGTPESFTGSIDEVRIWTLARTQCEINTYKNCEIATTATGLLANYHFNQGLDSQPNATVTTLTDASGNSYTGTLSNFALTGTTSNWIAPGGVTTGSTTPASLTPPVTASPTSTTICSSQSAVLTGGGASTYVWTGGVTNGVAFAPSSTLSYTVTGTSTLTGCTGTAVATVNVSTTCPPGAALNLDGSNDRVTVPSSASLNFGTGDFTVESYFKSSVSQPNYAGIVVKANSASMVGFQMVVVGNKLAAEFGSSTLMLGTANGLQGTTTITDGNWHHLAMVVRRSQNKIELLVDGIIEASVVNSNISTMNVTVPASMMVGTERTSIAYLNGSLDEVRLWNVARTQCEINTYKNCEIATTASGLVANYHFNQGFAANPNPSETTLNDVSGNANNGTLANFALSGLTSNWVTPGAVITGSTTPASLTPAVTASATNSVICNGASTTLNGGGASTYVWTGGATNGVAFTPSSTQSYTVTGTSIYGCTNTAVQGVTVNPLPVVTASATNSVICNGASTTLNGGGASSYVWTGGVSNGVAFAPSSTQSYTVTGTNAANGCTNTAVQGVTVNPLPVVTASTTNSVICNGASTTLNGGGASTYVWTGGVTNGVAFTPSSTQSYTVTGTSALGCTNTAVQSVTVNPLPVISVNSGAICEGQSFTMIPFGATTYTYSSGSAMVTPTMTASYSVIGTDANGCISNVAAVSNVTVNAAPVITVNSGVICNGQSFTMTPSGANTYTYSSGSAVVTPTGNASYTVTGTDAIGCVSLLSAVSDVTVNALPVVTASISNAVICEGSTTTLNGGGADTYAWTGGITDGVAFAPVASGSYTVTGTSTLTGCSNTAVESVTVNTLPVVTASITNSVICEGVSTTVNGGGADTYVWTGGITDGVAFTPTVSGSYSVTGTNTLTGCTSTNVAVANVTVNPNPVVTAPDGAICSGGSFTITPSGANTYTISGGSNVVAPASTATYVVTGTSVDGCVGAPAVVTVSVQSSLTVSISGPAAICDGQPVSLTANGAATYQWNTGATSNTIAPTPTVNTTYSVVGSSGSCSDSTMVTITVNPNPTVTTVSSASVICAGQTVSLTASGATSYTWNASATGATFIDTPTVTTTYTVTGEDANGCMDTDTIQQSVSPCTSIESLNSEIVFKVYPNPGNGLAVVELYYDAKVIVMNAMGEVISNENLFEGKNQIDLRRFASGIYFVKVIRGGNQQTIKLIKE